MNMNTDINMDMDMDMNMDADMDMNTDINMDMDTDMDMDIFEINKILSEIGSLTSLDKFDVGIDLNIY